MFLKNRKILLFIAVWFVGSVLLFQNCNNSNFKMAESEDLESSGIAVLSSVGVEDNNNQNLSESESSSATAGGGSGSSSQSTYLNGQLYGSCTMQASADFKIQHNGAIDSNGKNLPNVPSGFGGATWPVTYCPNTGSNLDIRCASGFKPVQSNIAQMVCGPNCFTYWVTYNCAKVDGMTTISAAESSVEPVRSVSAPVWVFTNSVVCVGPTPPPAPIGAACSTPGQTKTNECGTATCQAQ